MQRPTPNAQRPTSKTWRTSSKVRESNSAHWALGVGRWALGVEILAALLFATALSAPMLAAAALVPGDFVRVTKGEMLMFEGKNLVRALKGQEFTVLKHDAVQKRVYVSFLKDDGTLVAATLPEAAVEPTPASASQHLQKGMEAFRDQRYDEAKRLLAHAAQDKTTAALAGALSTRINGALTGAAQGRSGTAAGKQAFATTLQGLRDTAEQLNKAGMPSLAFALDEGADRLGGTASATKLDRAEVGKRAAVAQRAILRARQALGLKRLVEAAKSIDEGLRAEPAQADLKAFQPKVQADIDEAQKLYDTANKVRRFDGGVIHALSAIDDGLKICADHAKLRELRKELNASFEERTSPPVTPAFLTAAKVSTPQQALEQGRHLYTNRCTQCHDLDMLDSRTVSGWEKMVANMSRRANLTPAEQTQIIDYIAAAQKTMEPGK